MRTWLADELNRFLEFTKGDRYEPAWVFLATTGMRRGEALGLRLTDLNLDASPSTATIRSTVSRTRMHVFRFVSEGGL